MEVILIANLISTAQFGLCRAAFQNIDATKHPFPCGWGLTGLEQVLARAQLSSLRSKRRRFTGLSLAALSAQVIAHSTVGS